jgi:uncharacterized membrane protein
MKELKLTSVAGIVSATGVIGAAILYIGSLFFMTKPEAEKEHEKIKVEVQAVAKDQVEMKGAMIEIKTDLKFVRTDLRDIKKKIK